MNNEWTRGIKRNREVVGEGETHRGQERKRKREGSKEPLEGERVRSGKKGGCWVSLGERKKQRGGSELGEMVKRRGRKAQGWSVT